VKPTLITSVLLARVKPIAMTIGGRKAQAIPNKD
jgi:hypothetical protein